MNKNFNLNIKKPCSEEFDNFQPTNAGGFCNMCQKEVINFTTMSESEILNYFKKRQNNTCGRFHKSQLKMYSGVNTSPRKYKINLLSVGLMSLSLFSFLPISNTQAEHLRNPTRIHINPKANIKQQKPGAKIDEGKHLVIGVVVDGNDTPISGVSIVLQGSTIGTITDNDGNFKFPEQLNTGDVLLFSFIGYHTQKIVVNENDPANLYLKMKFDDNEMDMVFMGEVEVNKIYRSKKSFWHKLKAIFK